MDGWREMSSNWQLLVGDYAEVLAVVEEVDAVIVDPPYSARTHAGHDAGATLANRAERAWTRSDGGVDIMRPRRELSYAAWGREEIAAFVRFWAPRNRGWFVAFSDSELLQDWRAEFAAAGLTTFQPLPVLIPGMSVRFGGDGPSSWAVYLNVARPKSLCRWGTLPGAYQATQGERVHIGGKPMSLMQRLVTDYTRVGDLVCDPCAGGGSTLLAALEEGRRAIGAEVDADSAAAARKRLEAHQPSVLRRVRAKRCVKCRTLYYQDAFAVDRAHLDRCQSWCRRCKAEWELGPEHRYRRMASSLGAKEPDSFRPPDGWTLELYLQRWREADGRCVLCGAGLTEWQTSGHNLDRIVNKRPHVPSNCRLVCWPCNEHKSNGVSLARDKEIQYWVAHYGRGRVPWDEVWPEKGYKKSTLPDVAPYLAPEDAEQLLLGGVR